MLLTIQNERLTLTVDSHGAQMMSLQTRDGTEYLWQGDEKTWPDRAPLLFPYIGRLWNQTCRVAGTAYPMGIHGFAAASEFTSAEQGDGVLKLVLEQSPETLARYPYHFTLEVCYTLAENSVEVNYRVTNHSREKMPFAIGGHPGFRVPLEAGEQFEDYQLDFSCPCRPDRIGFTEDLFLSGRNLPYPLEDQRTIRLQHSLFDEDAVILQNMAPSVTLRRPGSLRSVTLRYPDFPYLGIWHWPHARTPYVCLEPWSSLPSRQGIEEELTCKSDLIRLEPGETARRTWTITIT